jgi:hypothetical protein
MVPVKLRICAGTQWLRRPSLSSLRFNNLYYIHSLFQLLTVKLIFLIPGHFLLSRVLGEGGVGYLTPEENFEKNNGNICQSFANVWGKNWLLGLSIYHGWAVWVSGNIDVGHFWTRPDLPHFPKIVTRPDQTRSAGRPDPWTTVLWTVHCI